MTNYEFLKHMTVYMEGYEKTDNESILQRITATGFFASLNIKGKKTNIILTAKHFAEKMDRVTFILHYIEDDVLVSIPVSARVQWVLCNEADIAYCEIESIEKRFKKITGKDLYATMLTEDDFIKEYELENIDLLDEVIVAGYPNGEASTHHKHPIFKKGYISSLPSDCIEDKEGYIDVTAMGGYSGSPVFLDTTPPRFLGMLVSGAADSSAQVSCVSMYVPGFKILEFVKKS